MYTEIVDFFQLITSYLILIRHICLKGAAVPTAYDPTQENTSHFFQGQVSVDVYWELVDNPSDDHGTNYVYLLYTYFACVYSRLCHDNYYDVFIYLTM